MGFVIPYLISQKLHFDCGKHGHLRQRARHLVADLLQAIEPKGEATSKRILILPLLQRLGHPLHRVLGTRFVAGKGQRPLDRDGGRGLVAEGDGADGDTVLGSGGEGNAGNKAREGKDKEGQAGAVAGGRPKKLPQNRSHCVPHITPLA